MAATTTFQPGGYPGRPYGDFTGKQASTGAGPHNPGRITTLWGYGGAGHLYGSFADKETAAPTPVPPDPSPSPGGGGQIRRRRAPRYAPIGELPAVIVPGSLYVREARDGFYATGDVYESDAQITARRNALIISVLLLTS